MSDKFASGWFSRPDVRPWPTCFVALQRALVWVLESWQHLQQRGHLFSPASFARNRESHRGISFAYILLFDERSGT